MRSLNVSKDISMDFLLRALKNMEEYEKQQKCMA